MSGVRRWVASGVVVAGLVMCGLPWYAEVFTTELVAVEEGGASAYSVTVGESYSSMYVPGWVPLVGGVLVLGGMILGRGKRTNREEC